MKVSNYADLPTQYGDFKIFSIVEDSIEHAVVFKGDIKGKKNVLLRIHSECLTGDVFHSLRCDCGEQLDTSLNVISKEEKGVILYLRQEGRGIGLYNKINAYELQDKGYDTVEANTLLGFDDDLRTFELGAKIIQFLEIKSIRLLTNNPKKIDELKKLKVNIVERVPLITVPNKYNTNYLKTKRQKMNHLF